MKWSSDLAYAIGLITTDGSLSNDGRHIDFTSKDFDQIVTFARVLSLKNKIGEKGGGYSNQKKYFRIQFGDVILYRFLQELGLTTNKTKSLGALKIPRIFLLIF